MPFILSNVVTNFLSGNGATVMSNEQLLKLLNDNSGYLTQGNPIWDALRPIGMKIAEGGAWVLDGLYGVMGNLLNLLNIFDNPAFTELMHKIDPLKGFLLLMAVVGFFILLMFNKVNGATQAPLNLLLILCLTLMAPALWLTASSMTQGVFKAINKVDQSPGESIILENTTDLVAVAEEGWKLKDGENLNHYKHAKQIDMQEKIEKPDDVKNGEVFKKEIETDSKGKDSLVDIEQPSGFAAWLSKFFSPNYYRNKVHFFNIYLTELVSIVALAITSFKFAIIIVKMYGDYVLLVKGGLADFMGMQRVKAVFSELVGSFALLVYVPILFQIYIVATVYIKSMNFDFFTYIIAMAGAAWALENARSEVLHSVNKYIHIHPISVAQKKGLLYQLYNLGDRPPQFDDTLSDTDYCNKAKEDWKFMSEIMPQTGITFKGNWFSQTGRNYIGVSHLYKYAKKEFFYWGEQIFRQPGVITTVDISHLGLSKIKKELNKSIGESRDNARKGFSEDIRQEAGIEYQLLKELMEEMITGNESVKEVTTRYYISGKTKDEVQQQADKINQRLALRGYKSSFFLGEEDTELLALYRSHKEQKQAKNRQGKELTTNDLGTSYPLNYSQLIDPRGLYFGRTNTGGLVILDMWHKDYMRLSYNFVLLGIPGSGKSSTLKKIGSHNHLLGNYTYYFMANAENNRFMKAYDGLSLDASGRDGTVNPFQIFATVINELTGEVDEQESYNVSKNKLKIIFANIHGENDPELNTSLDMYIDLFYEKWFSDHQMVLENATQYEAIQYPLLEDFFRFIHDELYEEEKKIRSSLSEFEAKGYRSRKYL